MQPEPEISDQVDLNNFLHYGATVYIQLGDTENEKNYICSDGFTIQTIFVIDFKRNTQIDFSNCLFMVIPANHYEIQQSFLQSIKQLENADNGKDYSESYVREQEELMKQLEFEINQGVDKLYRTRRMPISYAQSFQLLHLRSSKYLSIINNSHDSLISEGYSYFLEDIPSARSLFMIEPCYKYQVEVNQFVNFSDLQYLNCVVEGKDCHLYWNNEANQKKMQATQVNQDQSFVDEDFKYQFHEIVVSMDKKSFLKLNLFSQFINEASNYLCYGDLVCLCLDSKQSYLQYKDLKHQLRNPFLQLLIDKIKSFQAGTTPKQNQSQISFLNPTYPLEERHDSRNEMKLFFEKPVDLEEKNKQGMWKIEGKNFLMGGKVDWNHEVRLKNIQTGHYLSVHSKNQMKSSGSQRDVQVYEIGLTEESNDNTLFKFKKIGDTVGKSIEANACFFIQNSTTQFYISAQINQYSKDHIPTPHQQSRKHFIPSLQNKGYIQNAFHCTKAQKLQVWETYFLQSCLPIILYGIQVLDDINREMVNTQLIIKKHQQFSLSILLDCLIEVYNFCLDESEFTSENFEVDKRMKYFRQKILREQRYLKYIALILFQIKKCAQMHFNDFQNKLNSSERKKEKIRRRKERMIVLIRLDVGFNKMLRKPQLLQRMLLINDQSSNRHFVDLLLLIVQIGFDLIKNICRDNYANQCESFKYFKVFKDYIGLDVGAEGCLISILAKNEKLLISLHSQDIIAQPFPERIQEDNDLNNSRITDIQKIPLLREPSKNQNLYQEQISENTLVHCFIQKYLDNRKSGSSVEFNLELMQFLNTITHNPINSLGITINQLLIIDLLALNQAPQGNEGLQQNSQLLIGIENREQSCYVTFKDSKTNQTHTLELFEIFPQISSGKINVPDNFEPYLQSQLMLYGSLCFGRNYFSKKEIKEHFPCQLILKYVNKNSRNIYLPSNIRASLLYILMCTHLDSQPRKVRIVPKLTHFIEMDDDEDVKQREHSETQNNSRNNQLLQNLSNISQKPKKSNFQGIREQNMVEEFVDEKDTITEAEMKQLKAYLFDYVEHEIYHSESRLSDGQTTSKVRYDNLTLQVVTIILKLLKYDVFRNFSFDKDDKRGKQDQQTQECEYERLIKCCLEILKDDSNNPNQPNLQYQYKQKKSVLKRKTVQHNLSLFTDQSDQEAQKPLTDEKLQSSVNKVPKNINPDGNSVIQEFKIDNLLQISQITLKKQYFRIIQEIKENNSSSGSSSKQKALNTQYEVDIKKCLLEMLTYLTEIRTEANISKVVKAIKQSIVISSSQIQKEQFYETFMPKIMSTGLTSIDGEESKLHDTSDPYEQLYQKRDFLKVLFHVFHSSKDQELSELALNLIIKCYQQRKLMMKSLKHVLILVDRREIKLFEHLEKQSKELKSLVEKTEIWLGTPEVINQQDFQYKFVVLQFLDIVKECTNIMFSNVNVDQLLLINKKIQVHSKDILMYRQNMLKSLNFHETIIELLRSNNFLLESVQQRTLENKLFLKIFEYFVKITTQITKRQKFIELKSIYRHLDVIMNYLRIIELGQIELINVLFKNNLEQLMKISDQLIIAVVNKIVPSYINVFQELSYKISINNRSAKNHHHAGAKGVQFHPRYIRFLQNIMYYKGDLLSFNMKMVLTVLSKDHNMGKYLFLIRNIDVNNPKSEKQSFGEYIFDLTYIPEQMEFNLPFIYHARFLEMICQFVNNLEDGLRIIQEQIMPLIRLDYLYYLMKIRSIYDEENIITQLYSILKLQVMKLIQNVWLKTPEHAKMFDFRNDSFVKRWIEYEKQVLIKQFTKTEKVQFDDPFEQELHTILNKEKQNQKSDIRHDNDQFNQKHREIFQHTEKLKYVLEQQEYEKLDYIVYLFDYLIPFIINVYNFYTIYERLSQDGNIKTIYDFATQELNQYISLQQQERVEKLVKNFQLQLTELQTAFKVTFKLQKFDDDHKRRLETYEREQQIKNYSQQENLDITMIDLPIQNLFDDDFNRKFNWRQNIINMLLDGEIKKLIIQERIVLVKAIANINGFDPENGMKLQDFLKRLVRLVSNKIEGFSKQQDELNSINLNIVYDSLVICYDLIHQTTLYDDNENQKKITQKQKEKSQRMRNDMQNLILQSQILKHCLNFICEQNFNQKNHQLRKFFNLFVQLSIITLEGGNPQVQKFFYQYFYSNQQSEYFFQCIANRFNEERNKQFKKHSVYDRMQNSLKRVEFCYVYFEFIDDLKHLLRFLQLLCENHYSVNQNWLRQQKNSRNNVDVMQLTTQILKANFKSDSKNLSINMGNFHTIMGCLDFLTEMIQGPCIENQVALIEGAFLDVCGLMLKENDSVVDKQTQLKAELSIEDNCTDEETKGCFKHCKKKKGKKTAQLINIYELEKKYFDKTDSFSQNKLLKDMEQCKNLLQQVLSQRSAQFAKLFKIQYNCDHLQHLWMVSRAKYKCLVTLESLFEGDIPVVQRKRIMQSVPESYLMINLIWVHQNFLHEKGGDYIEDLFTISSKSSFDDLNEETNILVLESGFKLFQFLRRYQEDFIEIKEPTDEPLQPSISVLNLVSEFINVGQSITNWGSSMLKRICFKELRNTHEGQQKSETNQTDQNEQLRKDFNDAKDFFQSRTLHIEVLRENNIYMIYFPKLPSCDYLTKDMIREFTDQVDRSTINSKVSYLQDKSVVIIDLLRHEYDQMKWFKSKLRALLKVDVPVEHLPIVFKFLSTLSFFCSFIQNIIIVTIVEGTTADEHKFSFAQGQLQKTAQKNNKDDQGQLLLRLQQFQIVIAIFLATYVGYKIVPLQRYRYQIKIKQIYEDEKNPPSPLMIKLYKLYFVTTHFLFSSEILYYFCYILFAVLGYWNPLFSALLLLDLFNRFPVARQIVMAVRKPLDQLLVTMVIFILFSYLYSIITYFNYYTDTDISIKLRAVNPSIVSGVSLGQTPDDHDIPMITFYDEDEQSQQACNYLLSCFIFIFDSTFKQNAGFASQNQNYFQYFRLFFDFSYVFLIINLITQIIAGIITDTFTQLRTKDDQKNEDQNNKCFICGKEKQILDRLAVKNGFKVHINDDHNWQSYLFYICYINHKNETELTGIESYVRECLNDVKTSWFPINRSKVTDLQEKKESQNQANEEEVYDDETLKIMEGEILTKLTDLKEKQQNLSETAKQLQQRYAQRMDQLPENKMFIEQQIKNITKKHSVPQDQQYLLRQSYNWQNE